MLEVRRSWRFSPDGDTDHTRDHHDLAPGGVSPAAVEHHTQRIFARLGLLPDDDTAHRPVTAVLRVLRSSLAAGSPARTATRPRSE